MSWCCKRGFYAFVAIFMLSHLAFAAGGLDKVNSLLDIVSAALIGFGVVVLTIAIMWAGFKIMFQGQTLREVSSPLLGGIIVGSASSIAGVLIN